MEKIAFFVEGLTEQFFVVKLLLEVCNRTDLIVEKKKAKGGSSIPFSITKISTYEPEKLDEIKYSFLIVDCGSDETVKSYIKEQREGLIKQDYSLIIGLCDLYPQTDLQRFRYGIYYQVPQTPIPIKFIISVNEIEAWFIAEDSHFERIDGTLTSNYIQTNYDIDLTTINVETIPKPSGTINDIYSLVGKRYAKKSNNIQRTINALDYSNIYLGLPERVPSLKELIECLNEILED